MQGKQEKIVHGHPSNNVHQHQSGQTVVANPIPRFTPGYCPFAFYNQHHHGQAQHPNMHQHYAPNTHYHGPK
jgi:hypothetical protein